MEWYYAKHGKQEGPVSLEDIRAKFKSGQVAPTDLIWKEGMSEWSAAGQVPEVSAPDPSPQIPSPSDPSQPSMEGLGSAMPTPAPGGGGPVNVSDEELGLPPAGSAVPNPSVTPGLATASLICGITALCLVCCGLGPFIGIGAVVCGHMQMARYKKNPDEQTGKGFVIAGLVTGYLAIVLGLVVIVFQLLGFFAELSEVTPPV